MEVRLGRILVTYSTNAGSIADVAEAIAEGFQKSRAWLKFSRLMKITRWTSMKARSWARLWFLAGKLQPAVSSGEIEGSSRERKWRTFPGHLNWRMITLNHLTSWRSFRVWSAIQRQLVDSNSKSGLRQSGMISN